jgi:hypothetical protein
MKKKSQTGREKGDKREKRERQERERKREREREERERERAVWGQATQARRVYSCFTRFTRVSFVALRRKVALT